MTHADAHLRVEFAPGEFPVLLGYAAVAIYACVPETDQMPAIGWMVAGLFVIERVTRAPSSFVASLLATGLVLWSGLYGATGRDSALVGAWFAYWPLVLVVASRWTFGLRASRTRWAIGAIGAVAAVAVARTGAIEPTTAPAFVAVAIAAPASLVAALAVSPRRGGGASRR